MKWEKSNDFRKKNWNYWSKYHGFCDVVFCIMTRSQKQEDREKVKKQKEVNDELKEEVLKMNYEQQRLREQEGILKLDIKSYTQRIV